MPITIARISRSLALSRSLDNATEREIRAMVMGKKAYLFCQTDEACERAAMMYSFFGACKVKGKNPERWLAYVLDHIGNTKDEELYKLLPEFWEDIIWININL